MDPGTAVTNFNQAIANKPDLIVAALLDTSSMIVPIQKAKQADIPVLVFDGRPDPSVDGDVMQVLSDNEALGAAAAQNLVEGLKAQGKDSGKHHRDHRHRVRLRVPGPDEGLRRRDGQDSRSTRSSTPRTATGTRR